MRTFTANTNWNTSQQKPNPSLQSPTCYESPPLNSLMKHKQLTSKKCGLSPPILEKRILAEPETKSLVNHEAAKVHTVFSRITLDHAAKVHIQIHR